jgi:nucleoside-triphosphatase
MKQKLIIISGERGEGKTTFLAQIVQELRKRKLKVGGILALGYWKQGVRDRFEIVNLSDDTSRIYCQRNPVEGWEKVVHFYINPEGDKFGNQALDTQILKDSDWVIIDEVGPFELQGKGWATAMQKLIHELNKPMIWVVRKSLVDKVIANWKVENYTVYNIQQYKADQIALSLI